MSVGAFGTTSSRCVHLQRLRNKLYPCNVPDRQMTGATADGSLNCSSSQGFGSTSLGDGSAHASVDGISTCSHDASSSPSLSGSLHSLSSLRARAALRGVGFVLLGAVLH